ncbi:MAG TPA: hypothetical protein PKA40_16885, partial [Cyclobacteriaceae bacterium]|nr:hypothetical protein [Cyclobacteriaceae bacterium]
MKRILLISFSVLLVILVIVYFSGPKPDHPKFNKAFSPMDGAPVALDAYLRFKESQHKLKPNNEAR